MRHLFFFLIMIWSLLPQFAHGAGGSLREQAYADQTRQTVATGRVVSLKTPSHEFLAIYTETVRPSALGAAIILHDRGGNPDIPAIVKGLRTQLPRHRWATLSLQMPVRESGATEADYYTLFPDAKMRMDAAVKFLQRESYQKFVVIGYGLGALMGLYSLSQNPDSVDAFVAISLSVPESGSPYVQTLGFLGNLAVPVLDMYAEFDRPAVLNTTRRRKLISRGNPLYRQDRISSSRYDYWHNEDLLIKRVYSWLSQVARNDIP